MTFFASRSGVSAFPIPLLVGLGLALAACSSGATGTADGGTSPTGDGSTVPPSGDGSTPADAGPSATTTYVYSSEPSVAGADAMLALLNARGAEGRAYIGPYLGGGPAGSAELFLRPTPTIVLAYAREAASPETPEAFVARLDAKGAQGFAFKGPLLLGVGTELVFVKNAARAVTYTYATAPASDDEAATAKALDELGAKGFAYLTDYATDATRPLARVRLFQKTTGATPSATYRYTFAPAATDRAAAEAELGARGQTGGAWKGALAFGGAAKFLFETASTTTSPVRYALEDDPGGGAAAVVAKLNPRGGEGYFYLGSYAFGGKSALVLMQGPPTALALTGTVLP